MGDNIQLVRQRDGTVEIFKAGKAVAATKVRDRRQARPLNTRNRPLKLHQMVEATVARQRQDIVQAVLRELDLQAAVVDSAAHEVAGEAVAVAVPLAAPQLLSATEFGTRIGVTDETVRLREKSGELFSILAPGRQRGRRYPDFQQWPGVRGEPLRRVLARLGPGCDGASAYQFFTSPTTDLAGLSPLEVLLGRVLMNAPTDPRAGRVVASAAPVRLGHVEEAAEAFSAALAA